MPTAGMVPNIVLTLTGKKPPGPAVKLPGWNLKKKMMMVRIGMATFHQVMVLLTRANSRTARKLNAVNTAIRMTVQKKPQPVVTPVFPLYRLGQ